MIHLQSINLKSKPRNSNEYPFNLPLARQFKELRFHSPVTFLVGENGSGKSTLLEAMAAGINAIAVRSEPRFVALLRRMGIPV